MTVDEQFEIYGYMMEFLENAFGSKAEIVLHDFRNLDKTIVKIRNSAITGRNEQSGITDFALNILKNMGKYDGQNGIYGYRTSAPGDKILKSYSQFIRDNDGKIVGMLCVNIDITMFEKMKEHIDWIMDFPAENEKKVQENFSLDMRDMMKLKMEDVLADYNCELIRLTQAEKKEIIVRLDNQGIFLLKGSVPLTAEKLAMSEASVYRYLKELNNEKQTME